MKSEIIAKSLVDAVTPQNSSVEIPRRSFLPSPFISASLPLRDIKSSLFVRKYNGIEMYLTGAPKVPYGVYGRLVLSLITTHAVLGNRDENGNVIISYSKQKDFLDELQAPASRGSKYLEQLEYFANTTFNYKARIQKRVQKTLFEDLDVSKDELSVTYESTGNISFIKRYDSATINDPEVPPEEKKRNMTIILSSDFVKLCIEHAVPINYTTYAKLSATGKDLYAWFIYRNNSLGEGESIFIPRDRFVEQFMPVKNEANPQMQLTANYQHLQEQIVEIKKYYPELKVQFNPKGAGITLYRSEPEILNDDTRYVLITSNTN